MVVSSARYPQRLGAEPATYETARGSESESSKSMCSPGTFRAGTVPKPAESSLDTTNSELASAGTEPRYLRTSSRTSLTSKSPDVDISSSPGSSCDMTELLASARVTAFTVSVSIDRNLLSSWVIDSMIISVVLPSRFFWRLSWALRKLCLLLPRASSSQWKPTRTSRTICITASVPVMPSFILSPKPTFPTFVVGKVKSIIMDSSLQLISTIMR
mmetsp:Transcript_6005/g.14371  ORF Transcript_6005/g.14371 Transcript_6005/m.14371 type:complete len:215 (+) Transcript_6005:706-1350(+)